MSARRFLYIMVLIAILAVASISAAKYVQGERLFPTSQTANYGFTENHGDVLQKVTPQMYYSDQDHGDVLQEVVP